MLRGIDSAKLPTSFQISIFGKGTDHISDKPALPNAPRHQFRELFYSFSARIFGKGTAPLSKSLLQKRRACEVSPQASQSSPRPARTFPVRPMPRGPENGHALLYPCKRQVSWLRDLQVCPPSRFSPVTSLSRAWQPLLHHSDEIAQVFHLLPFYPPACPPREGIRRHRPCFILLSPGSQLLLPGFSSLYMHKSHASTLNKANAAQGPSTQSPSAS